MSTITAPSHGDSSAAAPLRTGVAFAITVAVFYGLCTVAWLVAQESFLGFMNKLFHGLDFTTLLKPAAFSWAGFVEALVVMSAWALVAGTFFSWLRQRLEP